jgi:uncharacterized membrane protein YczE
MSLAGVVLIGLSIGVLQAVNLGTDPFNVLMSALTQRTGVRYAILNMLANILLAIPAFFLMRRSLGVSTVLLLVMVGFIADAIRMPLAPEVSALAMGARIAIVAAALLMQSLGAALCITSCLGVSPYDALYLLISERTRFSVRTARIALDVSFGAAGLIAGGIAGVATVLAAVCMGPAINFFLTRLAPPLGQEEGQRKKNRPLLS